MAHIPYILTNHPGTDRSKTWAKNTYYLPSKRVLPWEIINDFLDALRLFRLRSRYSVVVLGGSSRTDTFYLILQRLLQFNRKPVVQTECLWFTRPPLRQFFKKCLFRYLDKVVDCYVVYARREIRDYANTFHLPREKFVFIPYHTTIDINRITVTNGNYLFSGGNFARDYSCLSEAVKGLDIKIIIACTNSNALSGIGFPDNVNIVGVSSQEFRELVAGSSINVVALAGGLLHSGGQQTFLNAMAMGKPVIVTDPEGAKDYIDDGVNGILVPSGDYVKLRSAILKLISNQEFAAGLGEAARKKARDLDTEASLSAIARLAKCLVFKKECCENTDCR